MNPFDQRAKGWDTERRAARAQVIAGEIRQAAAGVAGRRAMDFGCGTGLVSFALQADFSSILLVDSSVAMVRQAQAKIDALGIANMTAACLDLTIAPYAGAPVDVIFSSMALHHIADIHAAIGALASALADGGMLCLIDLDTDSGAFHGGEPDFDGHNGFTHDAIQAAFDAAGLADVSVRTFYHDVKEVNGRDVPYSLFCCTGRKAFSGR